MGNPRRFVAQNPELLLRDAQNFYKVHPDLNTEELTTAFLEKWAGYRLEYKREFIEMVFRKVKD